MMADSYRGPYQFTEDGAIDCEVLHPDLGWVPFTASKDDPEPHGAALFNTLIESGVEVLAYG